ncbi:MAG TPA: DUF5663 domain-containing protein [Candidatus Moranbacteria bacterium]|nr:DUF5663 domain-containing protein [Candidatus Moranbacteria bacterium]
MGNGQIQQAREEVLRQLVKDLGIDSLSQEKQDELIIKMTELLLKRIFLETMERLGEEGREEYGKMMEGEVYPEQIEAFFQERIAGYDEIVQQSIDEFRAEMKEMKPQKEE